MSSTDDEHLPLCSTADTAVEEVSDDDHIDGLPEGVERSTGPSAEGQDVAEWSEESADEAETCGPRAMARAHTAWQNDYFILTDNRNYPDMRMRAKDRWKGRSDLGPKLTSKTLTVCHFGDDRAHPDQTILVLKAWMLHRWQVHEEQLLKKRCRLEAWGRELDNLRSEIRKRGGQKALHPKTVEKIMDWAPIAFQY